MTESRTVWILARERDRDAPDYTKQTHDGDCFIVAQHRKGAWHFKHPQRRWLEVPVAIVPSWVGRCRFCGGGR